MGKIKSSKSTIDLKHFLKIIYEHKEMERDNGKLLMSKLIIDLTYTERLIALLNIFPNLIIFKMFEEACYNLSCVPYSCRIWHSGVIVLELYAHREHKLHWESVRLHLLCAYVNMSTILAFIPPEIQFIWIAQFLFGSLRISTGSAAKRSGSRDKNINVSQKK